MLLLSTEAEPGSEDLYKREWNGRHVKTKGEKILLCQLKQTD